MGCLSPIAAILVIKKLNPDLAGLDSFLSVFVFVSLFIFTMLGSMLLWGRILVWLGILDKDEAKGYPYAKPWERKGLE